MKSFSGRKYLIIGTFILVAGLSFGPFTVKAATTVYLDLENQTIYKGDTFLVKIKISTPDKPINVIDGTLAYDNNKLEIKEVSTGGSLFVLWPKLPVFSNEKGNLAFIGGVPGGFQAEEGEVLKIFFIAKNNGEAKINFLDDFSVFLNDSKGTSAAPWLRPLSLNISKRPIEIPIKNEWQDLIDNDKTPPEFIEAIINRDPRLFDNQYFVSFFAVDKESGIAYYKIKEGNTDFVSVESPYFIKDQSLKSTVQIKVIDSAGNENIIIPKLPSVPISEVSYKIYLIWGFTIFVILALVFWLWRIWKTKLIRNI